jgi:hypothetical protein
MSEATSTARKPADYRRTHFPHEVLTPIEGDLDYPKVHLLQKEILANACSVPSNLGGGQHGHGGLVCSARNYEDISNVPYTRPPLPPAVFHENGATGPMMAENNRIYNTALDRYMEVNHIERTLFNQIIEALGPETMAPVTNNTTGIVEVTLPALFEYLFTTYGNVTASSIAIARANAANQVYIHSQPLAIIFANYRKFKDMSTAFGTHESDAHLINMATPMLQKAQIFNMDLRFWNRFPPHEKTWANFQTHFIDAQAELKISNPDITSIATPASLGYTDPHLNAMESLLNEYNATAPIYAPDPTNYPTPEPAPAQLANATTNDPNQLRLIDMITKLEAKIDAKVDAKANTGKTKDNKKKGKLIQNYCWTHGACSHIGKDCNKPATGHKQDATFINMMNGSTKNCFWIAPSTSP